MITKQLTQISNIKLNGGGGRGEKGAELCRTKIMQEESE